MSKILLFALMFFNLAPLAQAHDTAGDRQAILAMSGCYSVSYNFAETFPLQAGYKIHAPYNASGLEWVDVDQNSEHEITLQHILLIPGTDPLKHWSQTWVYESPTVLDFKGDNLWVKRTLSESERQSKWSQRVYQVDGSPQYECSAPWVKWNEHRYWECQSYSPLPRREFSQRHDYNILDRRNRHEIVATGWVQEADSVKLKVDGQNQTALVEEKGKNTYTKVDDKQCADGQAWWQTNKNIWHDINKAWAETYASLDSLHFRADIDGKNLWESLFDLADKEAKTSPYSGAATTSEARELIKKYLVP